jgi:hypothetical protein
MRLAASIVVVGLTGAAVAPAQAADEPTGFICTFKVGTAHAYEKGRFKRERASAITLQIANIADAAQSAVIISGERRTPVRSIRGINVRHIIDVAGEGYMNLTTIYDRDAGAATYPAVHARHFGVLGQPIVSNYRGSCIEK